MDVVLRPARMIGYYFLVLQIGPFQVTADPTQKWGSTDFPLIAAAHA